MNAPRDLSELRDIHLPETVSWWPPAPGWWLLAVLISLLLLSVWWLARYRRTTRLRRDGLRELNRLEAEYRRNQDSQWLTQQLSMLLRRIALSRFPRHEVASLIADDWLAFLDRTLAQAPDQPGFLGPAGKSLLEAPYNPDHAQDPADLLQLSRCWIMRVGNHRAELL